MRRATARSFVSVASLAMMLALAGGAAADADHDAPTDGAGYDFTEHVPGAARLEGRIRAPCCLKSTGQTLDIHGSPVALELRREIRNRLKKGESPDRIEADMVVRYGQQILATPSGNPLGKLGTGLALMFGAAGVGAFALLVRWRRRSPTHPASTSQDRPATTEDGADVKVLDERIDAELRDL